MKIIREYTGKDQVKSRENETNDIVQYIEDNQLVIFDMKNISRGYVVRR